MLPIPVDLPELGTRVIKAFQQINSDMLRRVWDEHDYRLDICIITRGKHMEHMGHSTSSVLGLPTRPPQILLKICAYMHIHVLGYCAKF